MPEAVRPRGSLALVWISGSLALALFVGQALALAPLHPDALALQMAWSARRFGEIVHQWTPEQLALYRRLLAVDGVLLLSYSLFGWLLARRTSVFVSLPQWARGLAAVLLPLAAVFDATENALQAWLTEVPRFGLVAPYVAATGCSLLKWVGIALFGLLLAAALWLDRSDDASTR